MRPVRSGSVSIVRRHIAGRNLSETQHVLDDRRQTFRLPDQIVRQRCVDLVWSPEYRRQRSTSQLHLGAHKAELVLGATLINSQVRVLNPFDDQCVFGVRMQLGAVEVQIGILLKKTVMRGNWKSMVKPVDRCCRLGNHLTLEVCAKGDLWVDDFGFGFDLWWDCDKDKGNYSVI